MMRRVLTQVANAAVKSKGSVFQNLYRKLVPRLGHNKAIWAIAHRLCRLTWKILHQGVRYIEFGNRPNPRAVQKRAAKLLRELRNLGYQYSFSRSPLRRHHNGRNGGWVFDVPPGFGPAIWHIAALDHRSSLDQSRPSTSAGSG